jgi:hypothetical protein
MRPLAKSEKRLFLILCGAVFLALNMIGLHAYLRTREALQHASSAARAELASGQSWLETAEILRPAQTWITSHPMHQLSADDASADLLKTERSEADKAGLKVTEENLLPAEEGAYGSTVVVAAKLSGPFEGVVRFLFSLQTSSAWRSIDKLTLRSDTQPPNVLVDLELRQYFHSSSSAADTTHPAAP